MLKGVANGWYARVHERAYTRVYMRIFTHVYVTGFCDEATVFEGIACDR